MPLVSEDKRWTILLMVLCGILSLGWAMTAMQLSERRCPFVRHYSPKFLDSLAATQSGLPDDSPVIIALEDYGVMRDQARKCQHLPFGASNTNPKNGN